jgi:hypothetical protein
MALEITGKIVQLLDLQSGTSIRGDWKKQDFILETEEQYPRKICISLWGDKIGDISGIQLGREIITVGITLESREFNGRWYTDVKGWRIQRNLGTKIPGAVIEGTSQSALPADSFTENPPKEEELDDLPF